MARSDEQIRTRLDRLEFEARHHPRRHAWRLGALALLGYGYPVLLLLLSFGLVVAILSLAPRAWQEATDARVLMIFGAVLVSVLVLTAAVLRTFCVTIPLPDGQPLAPDQSQRLRSLLEEVRLAAGGPIVHHILVTIDMNVAVTQQRRFGFWGPRKNYLLIGLPLLNVLTPEQLRAVLAHELGHLSGRHSSFGAWIYRINRTWESLATPFGTAGRLRWLVMGWFVRWYGGYFAISTLAQRRLHEYVADRHSADVAGPRLAGQSLVLLDWVGYLLQKRFWPELFHQASTQPVPPADLLGQMREFLMTRPDVATVRRWRERVHKSRTPITHEHPCLIDRLTALGCPDLVDEQCALWSDPARVKAIDPRAAAWSLVGESGQKLWSVVNASWKALVIQNWRLEHASARYLREKLAQEPPKAEQAIVRDSELAEQIWEQLQLTLHQAHPLDTPDLVRQFLVTYPHHAAAHFALGRWFLNQDDERAIEHLEAAMRFGSEYIAPALQMLLEYYRETGRDPEADPIRRRIETHQRDLAQSLKERLTIRRRDRYLPHGLDDKALAQVRRVLYRFPQVRAAHLARKQVRLFADKPIYVLAVSRRKGLFDANRPADKFLSDNLAAQLPIPCTVVVLRWSLRRLRARLLHACPEPVYVAGD